MATYLKRALKGAGISFIMGVVAAAMSYLARMLLARELHPSQYGLFYSVLTFVLFFLFLRDLGLQEALVKYTSQYRSQKDYNNLKTVITSVFLIEIIGSLILASIFIIFSGYLAQYYFKEHTAAKILKILIFYVFFSVFFRILRGFFQGYQKMFFYSSMEFAKNLFIFLFILVFFYFNFGVLTPALAYVSAAVMLFLFYLPIALKYFNPLNHKIVKLKDHTKNLFLFAIPSFATAVGGQIIGYADTIILTYFVSLTEVGIYNAVLPSALILFFLGRSVSSIAFPMSSELWSNGDKKRISEGLRLIHRYAFVFIIPMIGVALVFSKFLITAFFGPEYSSGYVAFQIILVGVLFYVVAMMNNNIILGIGKPKTVTKIVFLAVFLNVSINFLLIPRYGIEGAAFATSLSYFVVLIASTYKVTRFVESQFPIKEWLSVLFPGIGFLLFVFFMEKSIMLNPWLEISISAIFAMVFYLILCYLFGAVSFSEIKKYIKRLK